MLIIEANMAVYEVADRLHPAPARRRITEERPRLLHQEIGLAISAGEQVYESLMGKIGHRVLFGTEINPVRFTLSEMGCTFNIKTIGVYPAQSNSISKPI